MPGTDPSHSPDRRPLPGAGRTAVVTGASSGIGAATADAAGRRGLRRRPRAPGGSTG